MPLDLDAVGRSAPPREVAWTSRGALLYALGVGAGQDDPLRELAFTTENSRGVPQQALPTYGVVLLRANGWAVPFGDVSRAQILHAEQSLTLHRPLPVAGRARVTATLTGIYDRGSGALVMTELSAADLETDEPLMSAVTAAFVCGEGGFGGVRGPASEWERPGRAPDVRASFRTRPDQALLYRLSGDRNPLHSDPAFAVEAGFERPILHGLCTYGITGRLLLHTLCGSDPARFLAMRGRFTRPVFPGSELTVSAWVEAGEARFQTTVDDGTIVFDRGLLAFNS